jgi:hypothetical protein
MLGGVPSAKTRGVARRKSSATTERKRSRMRSTRSRPAWRSETLLYACRK